MSPGWSRCFITATEKYLIQAVCLQHHHHVCVVWPHFLLYIESRQQSFGVCTITQTHIMEARSTLGHKAAPSHRVSSCTCDRNIPNIGEQQNVHVLYVLQCQREGTHHVSFQWCAPQIDYLITICFSIHLWPFNSYILILKIVSCVSTFAISFSFPLMSHCMLSPTISVILHTPK